MTSRLPHPTIRGDIRLTDNTLLSARTFHLAAGWIWVKEPGDGDEIIKVMPSARVHELTDVVPQTTPDGTLLW